MKDKIGIEIRKGAKICNALANIINIKDNLLSVSDNDTNFEGVCNTLCKIEKELISIISKYPIREKLIKLINNQ